MKLPRLTASNLLLLRFPLIIILFAAMVVISERHITFITEGVGMQLFNSARFEEATRAEMEMNDLTGKAYRFATGDTSVTAIDVKLALDIFWSRVQVLKTRSYLDALASGGVVDVSIVPALVAALPSLEEAVNQLRFGEPQSYAGVAAFQVRFQQAVTDFSDKSYVARRNQLRQMVEKGIESLRDLKQLQLEYAVLACLTFVYVLFELYLSRRVNRKLNATVEEKQHLLISDHLTGIRNRRHFETALQASSMEADFAVVLVDLDGFKNVNDTLGHAAGDHLLRHVASVLSDLSGPGDIVSRLGGDEFAALLVGSRARAEAFARAANKRIAEPVIFEENAIMAAVSLGIAHSREPACAETPSGLMKCADIALYAAKAAGRNCARFATPEIMTESNRKRRLQEELKQAIADSHIDVAYQPIVSLKCGAAKGIEALVRWSHPEFGAISPHEIIDSAEQTGQILPLTLYVINRACEVRNRMSDCGHDLQVTVNVTPGLLNVPDFALAVHEVAKRNGIVRGQLLLELTEDAMMAENDVVDANIERFRAFGIYLAVDDFGKGYSNLSRLASLEFRKIKLDKSLIDRVTTSGRSLDIARSISRMAADLGINVVAEGVETADQKAVLAELGIALAQGYFYARPMNALALLAYLEKNEFIEPPPAFRVAG